MCVKLRRPTPSAESAALQSPGRRPQSGRSPGLERRERKPCKGEAGFCRSFSIRSAKQYFIEVKKFCSLCRPLQGLTESHPKTRVKEHTARGPSPWALLRRAFSALGIRLCLTRIPTGPMRERIKEGEEAHVFASGNWRHYRMNSPPHIESDGPNLCHRISNTPEASGSHCEAG